MADDALFDAPIASLVDQLSISDEIAMALVDHSGQLGELLDVAIAYERCAPPSVDRPDLPAETKLDAYATAVSWADSTMTQLATLEESPDLQRA